MKAKLLGKILVPVGAILFVLSFLSILRPDADRDLKYMAIQAMLSGAILLGSGSVTLAIADKE